jgi:hypothetical protein
VFCIHLQPEADVLTLQQGRPQKKSTAGAVQKVGNNFGRNLEIQRSYCSGLQLGSVHTGSVCG